MIANWKSIVVSPDVSIRTAWRALDTSGFRIVLVVNDNGQLEGVVTDGDIRRGLLQEAKLEDSVSEVLNVRPLTISSGLPSDRIIQIMEENNILAIPVVEDGVLVGVELLQELLNVPRIENPVFIMAGGFGTRLRPLTDSCPKPMLKVGNKPMLEIVIDSFIRSGFCNFYISTHYLPEVIREYFGDGCDKGISISYIHEETPLGTGGALGLLPTSLPQDLPIIVINGDILTKVDFRQLLTFHNKYEASATMCVREYEYKIPYGVVNSSGNKIISMEEKPTKRFSVNSGIYVISPEIVASVPKNIKIDLPDLLEEKILENNNVLMYPIHEYWLDIGRIDDFNQAQADIHSLGLL